MNVPPPGRGSAPPKVDVPAAALGSTPPATHETPGSTTAPIAPPYEQVAAAPALSRSELEARASLAEARVRATALALDKAPSHQAPGLRQELAREFGDWQARVVALVKLGAVDSKAVASFAQKIQQVALVHENIPLDKQQANPVQYQAAAVEAMRYVVADTNHSKLSATVVPNPPFGSSNQSGLREVIAENPLVLLPPLFEPHTLGGLSARPAPPPTTQVSLPDASGNPQSRTVRSDVVILFCPGLLTDESQFVDQSKAAVDAGIYGTRVATGTLADPDDNAKIIDQAIRDARAKVNNPNAKVVLVGYSQGATNIFAFMRDKTGAFAGERTGVEAIHMMHGAARGSQTVDATNAVWKYTSGGTLSPDEMTLANALVGGINDANARQNPNAQPVTLDSLRSGYQQAKGILQQPSVAASLKQAGVDPTSDASLALGLMRLALSGKDLSPLLASLPQGAAVGAQLAPLMQPFKNIPGASSVPANVTDPNFDPTPGFESCGTAYGTALMSDPQLEANVAGVPILNSVGRVPADRSDELVPPSNQGYWNMFRRLGLESDYQVTLDNQRLSPVLPNAIDLSPDAVGHWGEAHVSIQAEQQADDAAAAHFSAPGLTRSVLATLQAMGLL